MQKHAMPGIIKNSDQPERTKNTNAATSHATPLCLPFNLMGSSMSDAIHLNGHALQVRLHGM
jgi:hypothetical protein